MAIIVQKFGGSSVATPERIMRVARRVVETKEAGNQVIVIVSAMGDSTDDLIALAKAITDKPQAREMDMLLATGEIVSISLLAMAIDKLGHGVVSLTGSQGGILTEEVHGKAKIMEVNPERIHAELDNGNIVIVAGFQGVTEAGEITTLGRGGSDTTAVAIAAAMQADVCEIFTDVDGIYTTDPRIVPKARKLSTITYDEMLELASLGAQVLHPRSVELGKEYGVPIHVRSSFNHNPGTLVQEVSDEMGKEQMEKELMVSGVAYDMNVAKIGLFDVPDKPGVAMIIFKALAEARVNVDMIIQSAMRDNRNDIAFTVVQDDLETAVKVVEDVQKQIGGGAVAFEDNVAKVSIVGAGMISRPGVAAKMFEVLANESINIQMIATSEIKVSCVVMATDAKRAVVAIHEAFGLEAGEAANNEGFAS
ncbi:aspartate kinase [Heliophilum fasciatum]|uniref:Aspartokinase n=1 Tax=Heliophilum fasciatum TaxID=35700 RepID=A0A4R2RKW8_9FIRM|nr:aspartate kinase [Heliophilum fasciatum]MCW2278454.1 aspartate kinase [Heliophilum fasciatum]TCP63584.1 aspartate kinase [Heliophilum fasciatum]